MLHAYLPKINQGSFDDFLQTIDSTKETGYCLWKLVRACHKPANYIPPLRRPNNNWASSDSEKAELFSNQLESNFQPNETDSDLMPFMEQEQSPDIKLFNRDRGITNEWKTHKLLYTADIPISAMTMVATYADDTALISVNEYYLTAIHNLQVAVYKVGV